jgi:hypothetical protein
METQTKKLWLGNMRKVYGVPKLPHRIDAAYENQARGNLMAYYLDTNPARFDPAFEKLEIIARAGRFQTFGKEKFAQIVAEHYKGDMLARQMSEGTYKTVTSMPSLVLKVLFTAKYLSDPKLRREIAEREEYMYKCDRKEWTD